MVECHKCYMTAHAIAGAPDKSFEFECYECDTGRWYWLELDRISNAERDDPYLIKHVEEKDWVGPDFRQKINQYIGDQTR